MNRDFFGPGLPGLRIRNFLWLGQPHKNQLSLECVCLEKSRGGLGLLLLEAKCEALHLKQALRMVCSGRSSRDHIGYWIGGSLDLTMCGSLYTDLGFFHWDLLGFFFFLDGQIFSWLSYKKISPIILSYFSGNITEKTPFSTISRDSIEFQT